MSTAIPSEPNAPPFHSRLALPALKAVMMLEFPERNAKTRGSVVGPVRLKVKTASSPSLQPLTLRMGSTLGVSGGSDGDESDGGEFDGDESDDGESDDGGSDGGGSMLLGLLGLGGCFTLVTLPAGAV